MASCCLTATPSVGFKGFLIAVGNVELELYSWMQLSYHHTIVLMKDTQKNAAWEAGVSLTPQMDNVWMVQPSKLTSCNIKYSHHRGFIATHWCICYCISIFTLLDECALIYFIHNDKHVWDYCVWMHVLY